jgi:hypothetical protein
MSQKPFETLYIRQYRPFIAALINIIPMNEPVRSGNSAIMSSKEVLARASKLLTDSAQKASNVRQLDSLAQRQIQPRKDLLLHEAKKKTRKQDPQSKPEEYGLAFQDIYHGLAHRHDALEESFAKQAASAFEMGRHSMPLGQLADDSVASLPSLRGQGRQQYHERTLDSGDAWEPEAYARVMLTYFLHALEIERLVFLNKELVQDAKLIDCELDDAEAKVARLQVEKRACEQERDEYKFRWMEANKKISEEKKVFNGIPFGENGSGHGLVQSENGHPKQLTNKFSGKLDSYNGTSLRNGEKNVDIYDEKRSIPKQITSIPTIPQDQVVIKSKGMDTTTTSKINFYKNGHHTTAPNSMEGHFQNKKISQNEIELGIPYHNGLIKQAEPIMIHKMPYSMASQPYQMGLYNQTTSTPGQITSADGSKNSLMKIKVSLARHC